MLGELKTEIGKHSITVISGRSRSGKSFLLRQFKDECFLIDNLTKLKDADCKPPINLPLYEFNAAIDSDKPYICIDEASFLDEFQIIQLVKTALSKNKKIIMACQNAENELPLKWLVEICNEIKGGKLLFVELERWNGEMNYPDIKYTKTFPNESNKTNNPEVSEGVILDIITWGVICLMILGGFYIFNLAPVLMEWLTN